MISSLISFLGLPALDAHEIFVHQVIDFGPGPEKRQCNVVLFRGRQADLQGLFVWLTGHEALDGDGAFPGFGIPSLEDQRLLGPQVGYHRRIHVLEVDSVKSRFDVG